MTSSVSISAIIPVTDDYDDVATLYADYKRGLERCGKSFEVIYVLDGPYANILETLKCLKGRGEPIKIICFARSFGESGALRAGGDQAKGDIIVTLPAYQQVSSDAIKSLVEALDTCDMATARRTERKDPGLKIMQSKLFHTILRRLLDSSFHDLGCSARAVRRDVFAQLRVYGDQHRFLPLIAERQGFRVEEVDAPQEKLTGYRKAYFPLGVYIRRLLDILSIYFLLRFTYKPLRFFGLIGVALSALGVLVLAYIIVERLLFAVTLGDRPLLLLSSLLIVLGIQIIGVGLIGEIITFSSAEEMKEYRIEKII